jgi:hypothetical protein
MLVAMFVSFWRTILRTWHALMMKMLEGGSLVVCCIFSVVFLLSCHHVCTSTRQYACCETASSIVAIAPPPHQLSRDHENSIRDSIAYYYVPVVRIMIQESEIAVMAHRFRRIYSREKST